MDRVADIAHNLLQTALVRFDLAMMLIGEACFETQASLDTRGRPQVSTRLDIDGVTRRYHFRPWHLTWFYTYGPIPNTQLQYSHRCHNELCINPAHGIWEFDQQNKDRNGCKHGSHIILPDHTIIRVCPHDPPCLTPKIIESWDDDRVEKHNNNNSNSSKVND